MTRTQIAMGAFSLAVVLAGTVQSSGQTASMVTRISSTEAHSLMKTAHTSMEYHELAGYFSQQEAVYRAQAAAEKTELDRRAQVNAALYQKFPRPVDSAQYYYDSYASSADQAARQARHYEQLAANAPSN